MQSANIQLTMTYETESACGMVSGVQLRTCLASAQRHQLTQSVSMFTWFVVNVRSRFRVRFTAEVRVRVRVRVTNRMRRGL